MQHKRLSTIGRVGILLVVTLVATQAYQRTAFAQGMPPTLVVTDHVSTMEFHDQVTLIGRSAAITHSKIVSEVAGRVLRIDAPEGNSIAKGMPLVTIDPAKIQLSLDSKKAEAEQAKAAAKLAANNFKRAQELFAKNLISQSAMDSAEVWQHIQEEKFNQLDAERQSLARDLENCVIRSPYSGHTLHKMIDVGEWVTPGTPVYEMVDLSKVKVTVDLPERHFGHLANGSSVDISISNDTTRTVIGTVTGIAVSGSEETHTFPVIVTVDNSDGAIGGGELVRATLSLKERFTSLAVPKDAIVRQGTQTLVYAVVGAKATSIPVSTKATSGDYVAVSGDGLEENMQIVIRGNERLYPGSPVQVANTDIEKSANPGSSSEVAQNGESAENSGQ